MWPDDDGKAGAVPEDDPGEVLGRGLGLDRAARGGLPWLAGGVAALLAAAACVGSPATRAGLLAFLVVALTALLLASGVVLVAYELLLTRLGPGLARRIGRRRPARADGLADRWLDGP